MSHPEDIWIIEPRGVGLGARLRELWHYRHLLRYFALGAVQRTYRATVLGWVWLLLRPLIPVLISTLVFSEFAGLEAGPVPYFLFFLVGTAIWSLFEESVMWATRSLQIHGRVLTKLYFPRLILPLATLAPAMVEFGINLVLIIATLAYFLITEGRLFLTLGPHLLLLPAAAGLALTLAFGLGLWTAVLGAETRDVRFTLRYIMRFWFFLTPIIYPLALVPAEWRWLAAANPMTPVVQLFRQGIIGEQSEITGSQVTIAIGLMIVLLASGLWFFSRAEAEAVDRL